MRLYDSPEIFERPPERVATVYQSSFPLLSSKMAYLRAFRVPTNCIQKAMFDSGRRGPCTSSGRALRADRSGAERECPVDISPVQILSHRHCMFKGFGRPKPLFFSEIWCFSNFLRLSALKNEPTAQLRQYIQDDRLDSLKVYYIILTIILYSNN